MLMKKKKDPKHKDKKLSLSLPRYLTQESDCSAIFNSNNFENIFGDDQKNWIYYEYQFGY